MTADRDIPLISVLLRNWKSFLPAWLVLPITPLVLLYGANDDHLFLYFWLIVAPLFAAALWPSIRLRVRGTINHLEWFVWVFVIPLFLGGAVISVYQLVRATLS